MAGARSTSTLIKLTGLALSFCLLTGDACFRLAMAADSGVLTGDVRVTVNPANIRESLPVPGGTRKVTMALHDVDLQDALRALAKKGGFNVLVDESVTGTVSVDLNNVTIQDALETLKSYGNLVYEVRGKNLLVAEATSDKGKSFKKSATQVFHLRNANAKVVADFLNNTVFGDRNSSGGGSSSSGSGGGSSSSTGPVIADYNTNSIIVVADPSDIKVVEEHLSALDQPRLMKTWRLSQANVLDVATALASSLFNEGQPAILMTNSSSSSSSSGSSNGPVGSMPSSLRVTAESLAEGTGTSQSAHGGGSSGGSDQTSVVNDLTLRTRTQTTQMVQVNPNGPILMPDTRLNTLTLLGTAEQIELADSLLALLDRKIPQVVLEASLLEISENDANQFGIHIGTNGGAFSTGLTGIGSAFSHAIGRTGGNTGENVFRLTTDSIRTIPEFFYQINALISKKKAKILANPTIITSSDNEAAVSIVDEILRSVSVTQGSFGGATSKTYNIGEAGIVLNILPKVGANKTISMRVRPIVTSVLSQTTDLNGNMVTLLSKRESLAQNVQVKDGETFVLGGLIHSTNAQTVMGSPILSQLPIVGALARNSTTNKHRSELVIMITPHIVNDESDLAKSTPIMPGSGLQPANLSSNGKNGGNGMIPVSFSGTKGKPTGAISAMEPTKPFNTANHASDHADQDQAQPSPRPSGSLLPGDLAPAPRLEKHKASKLPEPKPNKREEATFMPVSSTSAGEADLSDENIQAILNKFK